VQCSFTFTAMLPTCLNPKLALALVVSIFSVTNPTLIQTHPPPKLNGAIHVLSSIMRNVLASATESEVGACFTNAQDACPLRTTLAEMGWPQPATPIQVDNSCAEGIINDTVKQRRSKAIDMRFYWVRDRVRQGHYRVHWKPGLENLADYFTKHHSPKHHKLMRPTYLHEPNSARPAPPPPARAHTVRFQIPRSVVRVC
jgi:hypothetical protein